MFNEIIRIRLRTERNEAGYTQQQLADLTGIDDSLLAKIEAGTRKPDPETIGKLAVFYGITTDYIFGLGTKKQNDKSRHPDE
jgi:transcriptional regulator with XRE-family HTH domain